MADFVDELLTREDVTHGERSSPSVIDALGVRFGTTFPEALLKIWGSDGIALKTLDAHIPGPTEILQLVEDGAWAGQLLVRGFVPVLDDHQSNYVAVIVHAPLAYRLSYLPHDDGSRLLYRDLNGFAKALLHALDVAQLADPYQTQGDYPPDTPRPTSDQDVARALMATDGRHEEWNYATQLLDASNLTEWTKLLETDHFVRRDVVARMRQMREPAIQELLRKDRLSFDAFAREAAEAARNAGLRVGKQENTVLQVEGMWIQLEVFFHRRNIPHAIPRMIVWFKDQIAGRHPRDRVDHFMTD